jgi:hypothetical protein
MANADAARGFWPIRHLTGGTIRLDEYGIASGYAANIFKGDAVKLIDDGTIQVAAASNRILGVFAGVEYTDASGNVVFNDYWPTGTVATNIKAKVFTDPQIVYGVQSAGSTVAADIGNLGDHVAGSGSTTTGLSAHELNGTTGTSAAGFRVLGKVGAPNNDWGTNVNLEVLIYEHEFNEHIDADGTPGV